MVRGAVNIDQLLREEGFDTPNSCARARGELEKAGLTHRGKTGIDASKVEPSRAALRTALVRTCGSRCLELDRQAPGRAREEVRVTPASCEVCGGSNNRRAAIACIRVLQRKRVERVVIVGGTPSQLRSVAELFAGAGISLRFVDGTNASAGRREALANRRWAQLVVIWFPTPLRHAVSDQYTEEPPHHLRVVVIPRRSIEALCDEVRRSYT
jgi:hypothetical protein